VTVREDNIVIFIIQNGESCDDGSHLLAKDKKVTAIKDATLERTRVMKQRCRYFIALILKTNVSSLLEEKILEETLRSLYNVTLELKL